MSGRHVVVIGAGLGGLSAAMRLSSAGFAVTVLERHSHAGGKMRTTASDAGPVDAGPTVLTMRYVFDALFTDAGTRLDDHVTLEREHHLARHWWPDGAILDLFDDPAQSRDSVARAFGGRSAKEFEQFNARMERLYSAFKEPMMEAAEPSQIALTKHVLSNPSIIPDMAPLSTLMASLKRQFSDPRLAQLFGRYATYVGGSPFQSPALLGLIWRSEARGVWRVKGGMHKLAAAMQSCAEHTGATFQFNSHVARIETQDNRARGVVLDDGTRIRADTVVFNGDPAALQQHLLGPGPQHAVAIKSVTPRSLSAYVWSFAAKPKGADLAYHNVFFGADPEDEFGPLEAGKMPNDPTLYICAQDRGGNAHPTGLERFEIIMNGPPVAPGAQRPETENDICRTRVFQTLQHYGLTFSPRPSAETLTTPHGFQTLFPGSAGSLYGRSPHGMMAAFARPTARTRLKGLYLSGGGTHPGAGIPMATLSGQHAAEAIQRDHALTLTSRQTGTRGGMLTGSATMASAPSRSSGS